MNWPHIAVKGPTGVKGPHRSERGSHAGNGAHEDEGVHRGKWAQPTEVSFKQGGGQKIFRSLRWRIYPLLSHFKMMAPINQSINQSVNQSIDRSIDRSINQSVSQSVSQSINQSINQSNTDISLVGAVSHERVNRRRRWMAVSGMTCRRS